MIKGARQLPTTHVSVRVPWHDGRWAGTVCSKPRGNTSCLILPRIAAGRNDDAEARSHGKAWDPDGNDLPACAAERGAFMSPFAYTRVVNHPYAHNELYKHFRPTRFTHPAYSAGAVPFAWMMKEDGIPVRATSCKINFRPEIEPDLDFDPLWVQERRNQLMMLDTFFGAITPKESLVFFYAKRVPLTDDARRVIVGVGRVLAVDPAVEYSYQAETAGDALRCVLWERNLHHSIRTSMVDGFLLPYHDLLARAAREPDLDLASCVVHAPVESWQAFSMGAEHVSHDQAITALLACASGLDRFAKYVAGDWHRVRTWIDAELNKVWRLRGPFPGLGSALTAFGLNDGTLIAHAISQLVCPDGIRDEPRDPWPVVEQILRSPSLLPGDLAAQMGPSVVQLWDSLPAERRALLKLLARFEITAEQATRWYVPEERARAGIELSDAGILANPYLCYEADRRQSDPIRVGVVDRGLFPDPIIAAAAAVPKPSACEAIDKRRGRALAMTVLDVAASEGHTLLPQDWLVQRVRDSAVMPACAISADWLNAFGTYLGDTFVLQGNAWQLREYAMTREIIAARVRKRLAGTRHSGDHDWRKRIDGELPSFDDATDKEAEELARREKVVALEELYRSRFSVLVGPAGTGKTSLLTALLSLGPVRGGGVLLLAPTGKARVQMQKRASDLKAYTLAQFLLRNGRYNAATQQYRPTGQSDREGGFKTVVIDEASMLTEDQLAAALDALEMSVVERLILVGDPRQLPPIGAGRPFVDIVRELRGRTPRVGYAELRIVRRQGQTDRDDIVVSRWFGGEAKEPGADEVWDRLISGTASGIRAVPWKSDADLHEKLRAEIERVTKRLGEGNGYAGDLPEAAFEVSLGGRWFRDRVYFNIARADEANQTILRGGSADVESWQILAPIRSGESGVDGINRLIQKTYRRRVREWVETEKPWQRRICKPLGPQGLLYGDKVINVANGRRYDRYPEIDDPYVANGELGLIVGQYKGQNWKLKGLPWKQEVEFSSQLGVKYGFGERDFGEDRDASLELAYALTVHKAQGSEFGITFVIVPDPCRLLSRELLYTALTRQRNEIVLFHQGNVRELVKYSREDYSETARRVTNLFAAPELVEHKSLFLEAGLIHRTTRGELVRSKSEVIIANLLHKLGVSYAYEQQFAGTDGSARYPDFTIDDAESGRRILIEHLGMLSDPAYARRWEAKLAWYAKQDVKPLGEANSGDTVLITTSEEQGIDSAAIEARIRSLLE